MGVRGGMCARIGRSRGRVGRRCRGRRRWGRGDREINVPTLYQALDCRVETANVVAVVTQLLAPRVDNLVDGHRQIGIR